MTIIIEKISNKHRLGHLIFDDNINSKSYANAVLLRDYYQDHDIDFSRDNDWRYYFIVRRHFLRKKKKENGGKWICHYCKEEMTKLQKRNSRHIRGKNYVTIDHKVALANGGNKLSTENMVESCSDCNEKKGKQNYRVFVNSFN